MTSPEQICTAQLTESYPPIIDGVSRVVAEYYRHLKNYGSCYVVTPRMSSDDDRKGDILYYSSLPFLLYRPYRLGLPWFSPSLIQRLSSLPLQLVHAHSPFISGMLALQLARERKIPVVTTFHTKYLDDVEHLFPGMKVPIRIVRRYLAKFYKKVDQVWVPNAAVIETLREYGYRGPVKVVDHGTDITPPPDTAAARAHAEKLLGIDRGQRMIVFVGRLVGEKNLFFLLEAIRLAQESGARFATRLVGDGYARQDLERKAKNLGLEDTVFIGQTRERETLATILTRTDLLVFPSLYDTCGLVVKEAATMGVPALLLNGAAAAAGVIDNVNGFLSPYDPAAYAKRIREILTADDLRQKAGEEARNTLARTWRQVAEEVVQLYRSLIYEKAGGN